MELEMDKRFALIDGLELRERSIKTQRDDNNFQLKCLIDSFQRSLKNDWLYCHLSKGIHFASHPDYRDSLYSDLSVTPVDLVVVYLKLGLPSARRHNFQIDSWVYDACYAHLTDKSAVKSSGKSAGTSAGTSARTSAGTSARTSAGTSARTSAGTSARTSAGTSARTSTDQSTDQSTAEEDSSRLRDEFYEKIYSCMKDIFFEDTFLIPSKVMTWFNKLVESTIESYNRSRAPSLRIRNQGTSTDFSIVYQINIQGRVLYFTLVPVIDCIMTIPPNRRDQRVINFESSKAILVPKPYDFRESEGAANLTADSVQSIERVWQVNMYEAERIILSIAEIGCAKKVIKLLKLLRNKERWFTLNKYCLKTIVMSMIIRNPDPQEWRDDLLLDRLKEALEFLKDSLVSRSLDYCFGRTNMFHTLESHTLYANNCAADITARLKEVILLILSHILLSVNQLRDAFLETETSHTDTAITYTSHYI